MFDDEEEVPFEGKLLTLTDESGTNVQYEHLDTVVLDSTYYFALVPAFEEPEEYIDADGELVIMKVVEEDGEQVLIGLSEEAPEFHLVFQMFEERLAEEYTILSDEEE